MFASPNPSHDEQLSLLPGQTTTISLASNPTTGYTWSIVSCPDHIDVEEDDVQAGGRAIGSGGRQTFTISAITTGHGTLVLQYARSWETRNAQTKHYEVDVL